MGRSLMQKVLAFFTFDGGEYENPEFGYEEHVEEDRKGGKVYNMKERYPRAQVALCNPRSLDEAQEVADMIKNRRAVLVNLQRVDGEMARRMVDFLLGLTYAVDGEMHRVEEKIFMFSPTNIEVLPFEHKESVDDGIYFSAR